MGKFRRIILVGVGSVVALGAIVLLGVNLYVQSRSIQAKIQHELSQRLGTPLQIRQISVTPWGGLKLSGIAIPQTSAVSASAFLDAKTFRLRIRFFSLFAKRLVVKEVSLVDPTVVWPQNSEGKWRLPGAPEKEVAESASGAPGGGLTFVRGAVRLPRQDFDRVRHRPVGQEGGDQCTSRDDSVPCWLPCS